ncbi:thermonuclease family protein [Mesorhizobium sp. AaZ16]|uniref:thermonuclease family protein n=1 Tax=Mesorhizobium sp. AaZ16 TaxID=3402289 RepID=UPI00374EC180
MRALHFVAAVAGLAGASIAILAGGRALIPHESPDISSVASPEGPETAAVPKADPPRPTIRSRTAQPDGKAGPPSVPEEFERVSPRAPLGELGLALPPKAPISDDWEGTLLHRPVVPAAGMIEAMGHTVAIAGIDAVAPDETCLFEGKEWACGVRARTMFRALLRGRAVTCAVPLEPDRNVVTAPCRLGRQDLGRWLVLYGWARADADGPYGDDAEKAKRAKKGIFGRPPDTDSLPPPSSTTSALPRPPADPTAPSE